MKLKILFSITDTGMDGYSWYFTICSMRIYELSLVMFQVLKFANYIIVMENDIFFLFFPYLHVL